MNRAWIAFLILLSAILSFTPGAYAARKHNIPNPIGKVLTMILMPVADTIDYSRDVVGLEADTDLAAKQETEMVSADTVDLWGRQSSQDEMNALGVKMTVVN